MWIHGGYKDRAGSKFNRKSVGRAEKGEGRMKKKKHKTHTSLALKLNIDTLEILESPVRSLLVRVSDAPTIQRDPSRHVPRAFQRTRSDGRGTAILAGYEAHAFLFLVASVL